MTTEGPVAYFALGGTIAMTDSPDGGVVARLTGEDLVAELGKLPVDVQVYDAPSVPSSALTVDQLLDVLDAARRAVADGACGVVISQGTDSLEETAFLADSVWGDPAPIVFTGAMRNPTLPGADGPANLAAAFRVAADDGARGRGVLVVFSDEIHAARHVRKSHSTSPATFVSPDAGPIGHVVEGSPRLLGTLPPRAPISGWTRDQVAATRVALYTATLDDDGLLLPAPHHGYRGLVVAAFGAGHMPARLVPALTELAELMPVVLTSRTGAGPVLADTYGGPGAERDLLARGLINGGFVHPYKARLLLRLLVAGGASRTEIAAAFAALG